MAKSFKHFRIQFGTKLDKRKANDDGKTIYKHSVYMQSRDNSWINRNMKEDGSAETTDENDLQD